jgi:hypothetical protein
MSIDTARMILGRRPEWELRAIVRALSIHRFLNTPEEEARLKAARILLRAKK